MSGAEHSGKGTVQTVGNLPDDEQRLGDTKRTVKNPITNVRYMIQDLVEVASKDGNYLLNIGPKGDGTMTAGSRKILKGHWQLDESIW